MIKIKKEEAEVLVSKETYETLYKRMGYKPVETKKVEEPKKNIIVDSKKSK